MRYSSSMLVAIVISFFVFLGMSILVSTPKLNKSTQIEMVSFSKVQDIESTVMKYDKPKEPPKQEKVKQPPSAPSIDIVDNSTDRAALVIPIGKAKIIDASISKLSLPNITNPGINGETSRELYPMLMVQAIYPPDALRTKTEGWVKVKFIVNEFGLVSHAKVIDAKPRRVFNRSALKAIQKSKFKPLIVDGKKMPQTAVQVIEFKIKEQ